MKLRNRLVIALLALIATYICVVVGFQLIDTPDRLTQRFVGHLSRSRYQEAAAMLREPSAIRLNSEGNLEITDRVSKITTVPSQRLPFLSGGGKLEKRCDFSMAAIQGDVNGLLNTPGIVAYFSIDRGKVRIDSVE
jgi:hypothetical protein